MSDQKDHINPDPIRPSQAEGEAENASEEKAETQLAAAHEENEQADLTPLRPSKAEGGSEDGAARGSI